MTPKKVAMIYNFNLEISDSPDANDIKALEAGLANFTPSHIGPRNYIPLGIFLRDEKGEVVAGLEACTYWQWLHIRLLWVADNLRGKGVGSRLVKKAEEIAKNRGCHATVVDTLSFQAPEFYKKLGFVKFGELDNFPRGQKRIYLSKPL